jgi:hypothetical protein
MNEDQESKIVITINQMQQVLPWNVADGRLQNTMFSPHMTNVLDEAKLSLDKETNSLLLYDSK